MTRVLVVDNYDSFVHTIVGYLQQLGADCTVVRNDAVTPQEGADYDGVLVSPGPGTPEAAGVSMAMIEACAERAQLAIDPATMPDELVANGVTESGVIMAVRHRDLPLHGVQFHPESVLTQGGHRMLANWLSVCGDAGAIERSVGLSPLVSAHA